jgi:hypothetical protein
MHQLHNTQCDTKKKHSKQLICQFLWLWSHQNSYNAHDVVQLTRLQLSASTCFFSQVCCCVLVAAFSVCVCGEVNKNCIRAVHACAPKAFFFALTSA